MRLAMVKGDRSVLKPLFEEENNGAANGADGVGDSLMACAVPPPPPPPPPPTPPSLPQPFPSQLTPYVIPASSPIDGDLCLPDLARQKLHLVEKLGEGAFGSIHFCEAEGLAEFGASIMPAARKLVVLRIVRINKSEHKYDDLRFLFCFISKGFAT